MERCLDDIDFIDSVLALLADELSTLEPEPRRAQSGESKSEFPAESSVPTLGVDLIADTEWQFSQLLTGLPLTSGAFADYAGPEGKELVKRLQRSSNSRRKTFERLVGTEGGIDDQLVTPTELSLLFGGS
jgi:hypothetical protein